MDPSKLYVEYYAKLHTDRAMRLWPSYLRKNERPDFVSKHRELGLEVTRAAIEEWAQQEADMNRQFGNEMPGEAVEQAILAECETGAIADGMEDGEPLSLFELPQDVKDMHIGRIIERIMDKTAAMKSYQTCRENWLYIFSETSGLDREDMLRIQSFVDAQTDSPQFDKVLIKVGCQLFVLVQGEPLSEVALSARTLLHLHQRARWLSLKNGRNNNHTKQAT